MVDEKVVPHMTDIIKVVANEAVLRTFLEDIKLNNYSREEVAKLLESNSNLELNLETSKRYVGSLCTYHFLKEDNKILLTDTSEEYIMGETSYPDYILKCISS